MNSLVSIFKTGLCPGSMQKEKSKHLADLRPSEEGAGKRTTVQFAAISNSKRKFMVREKKPLLIVYSATAIAANFETWVFDDDPIVATPNMIRSDLSLAVLTANNVIYEDEACPPFVVKNIAFWWDGYLKQKDIKTYSDGQAAAASFNAQGIFKVRKLIDASASACAREVNKDKKPPSHLRGKQTAEWKALHDPDSLEAQLAGTSGTSCTTTYTVPPPPPSHPPPKENRQFPPPPSPEPTPMEVDQETQTASSAALPAETPKEEKESELSDKEKADKDKDKEEEDDSDLSSLGDDLPAEAEDQDADEEREVANRLVKHKSVNAGEERSFSRTTRVRPSLSQKVKRLPPNLLPNYRTKVWKVKNSSKMIRLLSPISGESGRARRTLQSRHLHQQRPRRRNIVRPNKGGRIRCLQRASLRHTGNVQSQAQHAMQSPRGAPTRLRR